ncbi:uncharacterized protein LOC124137524 [Haliotis rufescens]|uniref:uncharacterized protein LOC124137524 n=1 Tax=Haliotis rufescens TaxID=6454 RepID=UPI00201EF22B|nr:uncharacterized protein LOC124137524 [Haliotis rufescens]
MTQYRAERWKYGTRLSPVLEEPDPCPSSPTASDLREHLLARYREIKFQVGIVVERVVDHLLDENQKLRQENEQQYIDLGLRDYKLENFNYMLSCSMGPVDFQEVKQRLDNLAKSWESEKQAGVRQRKMLEEELKQLRSSHQHVVSELAALRPQTVQLTCQVPDKNRTGPTTIPPPVHPRKVHRLCTRRSKNVTCSNTKWRTKDPSASGDSLNKAKVTTESKNKSKVISDGGIMSKEKPSQNTQKKPLPPARPIRVTKEAAVRKTR